eukprot:g1288.t1
MNPQTRKVAPRDNSGRKLCSTGGLGLGPQMPVRSSSTISKRLLQSGVLDRLQAEETKTLQSLFNEVLDNFTVVSKANLAKFLDNKVNLNEIWQNTYGTPWNPSKKNLKSLSQNFLQACMAYIRAQSTGRPDPKKGLLTRVDGSKIDLFTSRLFHKGANGVFVSTAQVILNSYMLFSKVSKESEFDTQIQIQIFFIMAVSFSCGFSLTNLVQEHQRQQSRKGFYKSMTQIHPPDSDDFGIVIAKTCWNIFHFMMVTCGLGALIAKAPLALWISLVVGFLIVLNILRCIINEGEMRFYKRMDLSNFATATFTIMFMIISALGVGLMPLSILRWHNVLSPIVFGVGWISSFLISSVSVLYFSSNVNLWVAFGCLSLLYVLTVYVYFRMLKPGAWKTFIWSNKNWRGKLRSEWWKSTYESIMWEDIHLIGDRDAHYAGMILCYLETDLPWKKLTAWLKERKTIFRDTPPTWLTAEWLVSLPKKVIADVWNISEYRDLLDQICEVEKSFAAKISTKRALPAFKGGPKLLKSIDVQSTTLTDPPKLKPKKCFNQSTKMKIHPISENTFKNDSVENNNVPNTKPDKDLDVDVKWKSSRKNENAQSKSSVGDRKLIMKGEDDVTNGTNIEVISEKDQDTFPNIVSNNDPGHERVAEEDERTKAIRREVVKNMRRMSSFGGSVLTSTKMRTVGEKDIPSVLKELFEKAETMQVDEIREASKEAVDGELFATLFGQEKDATGEDIMLIILKGFLRQWKKGEEKKNINEGVPRILLAAFFELFDEVSDIILAGLFYADTDNKRWAGHLMFAFMGLNRLMQGLFSLSFGESKWR